MICERVLEHGTWGRVIALIADGARVERPFGTVQWLPPRVDLGSVQVTHPHYPQSVLTHRLGPLQCPAIEVPADSAVVSPTWATLIAALSASMNVTQLLADVPQPAADVLATRLVQSIKQARAHYVEKVQRGLDVTIDGETQRIGITDLHLAIYTTLLAAHANSPPDTLVIFDDNGGQPITTTVQVLRAKHDDVATAVRQLKESWSQVITAMQAAETPEQITQLLNTYTGS